MSSGPERDVPALTRADPREAVSGRSEETIGAGNGRGGRLEVRPRNAESPANARLSGERLKGFEPSTFCMASSISTPGDRPEMPANPRMPAQERDVGFPGIAARSQRFRQGRDNEGVVDYPLSV